MNLTWKSVLPLAVVVIGIAGAAALISARPRVETIRPEAVAPLVRVMEVKAADRRFSVHSQGTVTPRTSSTLVPEVAGRVTFTAPEFESGGFFRTADVLLRVDPRDYELALVRARARVAAAELLLRREEEEAEVARDEWAAIGEGEPAALVLREPQLAEARSAWDAAVAERERAELDLERTAIRAPFDGRVREKSVDVGQYVAPGTPLGRIYSVDFAEVRLPIPDSDLAFIDLPLGYRGDDGWRNGPEVALRARFAGQQHEWKGRIVRTEGELDPRSRMVHVVARVSDPYGRGDDPGRPPLAVGMFVEAEIAGRLAEGVFEIPRSALRGESQILVVDGESRLHIRDVVILKTNREIAVIGSGLEDGERICLSPIETVVEGMPVRVP
jgi:RND family efflux transporter MFP subunit